MDGLRAKANSAEYTKDIPQRHDRSALEGLATGVISGEKQLPSCPQRASEKLLIFEVEFPLSA